MRMPTTRIAVSLLLVATFIVAVAGMSGGPTAAAPDATTVRTAVITTPPEVAALFAASPAVRTQGDQLAQQGDQLLVSENFDGAFPPDGWHAVPAQGAEPTVLWSKADCDFDPRTPGNVASAWSVGGGTLGSNLACGSEYTAPVTDFLVADPVSLAAFDGGVQVEWSSDYKVPQVDDPTTQFPYAVCVNVGADTSPCLVPNAIDTQGQWVTFTPPPVSGTENVEQAQVYFLYRDAAPTGADFGAFIDNVRITGIGAPVPTATSAVPERNPAVHLPSAFNKASLDDLPDVGTSRGAFVNFGTGYDPERGMLIDAGDAFQFGITRLCSKITWTGLDVGTQLHWQWLLNGTEVGDDTVNPTFNVDTRSGAMPSCISASQGGQNVPIPEGTFLVRVYLAGNPFPDAEGQCMVQPDPPPGKTAIPSPTSIPTIAPTPTPQETPGTGPDCREFLTNGDFERGPGVAWRYLMQPVVQGRTIVDVIRNDIGAPQGQWAARMGGAIAQGGIFVDQLDQPSSPTGLPDPTRILSATLRYVGGMVTQEVADGTNTDILLPGFQSITNTTIDPEPVLTAAFSEESVQSGQLYQFEADVTALMTKRPDWDDSLFFFQSQQNDTAASSFFVDSASLEVCRTRAAVAARPAPAGHGPRPLDAWLDLRFPIVDQADGSAAAPVKIIPLGKTLELPKPELAGAEAQSTGHWLGAVTAQGLGGATTEFHATAGK